MTVLEAITRIDALKPNAYPVADKLRWLSAVDACVAGQLRQDCRPFSGYAAVGDTELLVPEGYEEMYLHYLSAQMDLYNGEYTRFNNSIALYDALFREYANFYRRTHLPQGRSMKYK